MKKYILLLLGLLSVSDLFASGGFSNSDAPFIFGLVYAVIILLELLINWLIKWIAQKLSSKVVLYKNLFLYATFPSIVASIIVIVLSPALVGESAVILVFLPLILWIGGIIYVLKK